MSTSTKNGKHLKRKNMKKILLASAMCAMFVACSGNSDNSNNRSEMSASETQPSDWEITTNVKKTLMMDGSLSRSARMISVTTHDGVVILTGSVESRDEGRKVVNMVKGVKGVKSVDNQLDMPTP